MKANCHIYSELEVDDTKNNRESVEQTRRAEKFIRTLQIETHDYLMQLFWQHYNSVLMVVHEEAFNEDREHGRTQYYSGFLHICILAMGYRFADKARPDIQRIALPDRESTLHRECKYMLDLELERPGGIPSVAALLILGDAEVAIGRDNVGWMYAGMAMRLCYDIGLHLDSTQSGMTPREVDIRKMTLWACVIYDRYWSLFLGRPTSMKSADLEIYNLADQFGRLGTCQTAGIGKSINTRVYEALIDLMEIAGKIVENVDHRRQGDPAHTPDQSAYFRMAAIDRELHNWMARLPQDLRNTEENQRSAPFVFYLLHQQYHAVLILLHRPFARYDDNTETDDQTISALDSHFSRASRAICTKSAVAVARIFWQHRQRFDGRQIFCIGMQHAGTAATALVAALAYLPDATDRTNNMMYLEVLHAALQDMACNYHPAERMAAVLKAVMVELQGGPVSPNKNAYAGPSTIPARRGSTAIDLEDGRPALKSRKIRPATATRTAARDHRASDASESITSHGFPRTSDFVMVTPHTDLTSWPDMQGLEDLTTHQGEAASNDWMMSHFDTNDFDSMPALTNLPNVAETDISSLEFLSLPSDDDWKQWHAGSANVASDLDGFPPRQFPAQNLASPPMGGIMNG